MTDPSALSSVAVTGVDVIAGVGVVAGVDVIAGVGVVAGADVVADDGVLAISIADSKYFVDVTLFTN